MAEIEQFNTAAWDLRSLDQLKLKAGAHSPQALRAAAKQMEGIFIQQMLKSMRQAGMKDESQHSQASDMYTSMYDQQIAQDMAQKSQWGFAETIVRQFSAEATSSTAATVSTPGVPLSLAENRFSRLPSLSAMPVGDMAAAPVSDAPGLSSNTFIQRLLRPALDAAQRSGIHPHLILAQAALESGWGKREIRTEQGQPSHNLFGIKASGDWQGKTTQVTTTEYVNGVPEKVRAAFRVYDSYSDALTDYTRLLKNNPRYRSVVKAPSAEHGAQALQQGGYATDPAYAGKLISIIQQVRGSIDRRVAAYQTDLTQLF